MKERYMLPLRILVTLLILTMLLPGWGILSASHLQEETLIGVEATVGNLWAADR